MGVTIEDRSDEFLRKLTSAIEDEHGALDAATQFAASKTRESMPGAGANVFPGTGGDTGVAGKYKSSTPGQPPGVRDGILRGSIKNAKVGPLRWAFGTNIEYAKIQEFGGTVQNPGGQPYLSFGGKAVFVKKENAKPWMRRTQPHSITLPPRPFLRPTINVHRATIGKVFNAVLKAKMGGGA